MGRHIETNTKAPMGMLIPPEAARLARPFMRRGPVFLIPGSGRYLRQPLYIRDVCGIIAACLARQP